MSAAQSAHPPPGVKFSVLAFFFGGVVAAATSGSVRSTSMAGPSYFFLGGRLWPLKLSVFTTSLDEADTFCEAADDAGIVSRRDKGFAAPLEDDENVPSSLDEGVTEMAAATGPPTSTGKVKPKNMVSAKKYAIF